MIQRTSGFDDLLRDIRACRACRDRPQGPPLPHEPHPVLRARETARIAVCGQAPGTRVHASGVPFSDPSGVRLRQWMGIGDREFYDESRIAILPMGFCFPGLDAKGGDLPPRRECAPLWRARVFAGLQRLELVLLVGGYAQRWHLGADYPRTLTETVASWKIISQPRDGVRYLPLPHPSWRNNAWLAANPWFADELLPDLQSAIRSILNGALPNGP